MIAVTCAQRIMAITVLSPTGCDETVAMFYYNIADTREENHMIVT